MKDPGTVAGPYDEVLIPRGPVKTDWRSNPRSSSAAVRTTWTDRMPRGP